MPYRIAFELAGAILDEVQEAGGKRLESQKLLEDMRRLGKTKKESNPSFLEKNNLAAKCQISYVNLGEEKVPHPVLSVNDFVQMLSHEGRLDLLAGGRELQHACGVFWERYRCSNPGHTVYDLHKDRLSMCVPFCIYSDEGTSFKRNPFMVVAYQPCIGRGTSYSIARQRNEDDLGTNLLGSSYVTRFLFSCMKHTMYQHDPEILDSLLENFSLQCREAFEHGILVQLNNEEQRIYPTFLWAKGDWPALRKMANLSRAHNRCMAQGNRKRGICNLCLGGTVDFLDWHDINGSWLAPESLEAGPPPWDSESHITKNLVPPGPISERSWYYKPDLFHTLHKGLLAELAASAVVFGCKSAARLGWNLFPPVVSTV